MLEEETFKHGNFDFTSIEDYYIKMRIISLKLF